MAGKELLFHNAAQEKVLRGAHALADAVRLTLGPQARSVLVERKWGKPLVCDNGVTIAKEVSLHDPVENMGAQMMREAAEQTGTKVGDGTTTATLLAYTLYAEGLRNVVAGASALALKRGMERGLKVALEALKALSQPVRTHEERVHVAAVSAHNDAAIGELVASAVEKVGSDGVITLEESKGTETTVEVVEGMQFDRGYLSAYFVTDPDRQECVLEDAFVLLYDKRLSGMEELVPLLEQVVKEGRPLLVVAEEFVPGAGLALLRAIPALDLEEATVEGDERTGLRLLRRALEAPTRQIGENAGLDGGVVVDRMRTSTGHHGLDAARGVYVDLVQAGIIDAAKVVRLALENAVSVAGTLLLPEATLTEEPEKEPPAQERPELGM